MASPTVLIVMPLADQRGGAELALLNLVRTGGPIQWHVVFLEDGPMIQSVQAAGVQTTVIQAGRIRQPHRYLAAIFAISKLAKRIRARAILAWMSKAHIYGGPAAKLAGIPAVWFQHGLPHSGSAIEKVATHIPAAGSLTCSQFVADAQKKMIPTMSVRVAHPGADLVRFSPESTGSVAECRHIAGLPLDCPLIGIFGRLQSWKGIHFLIEAMPKVIAKYPKAKAVIVGGEWYLEPDYERKLHERAQSLQLNDHVFFAGHQQNIPQWMQACDVLVHAADHEPFGMTVIEAMSLGKPVVAGAEGGPREVITDGVDGFLAPFGDTEKIAGSILRYLDDPKLAASFGQAARQRAQDFSVQRFSRDVCDAMNQWMPPSDATLSACPAAGGENAAR